MNNQEFYNDLEQQVVKYDIHRSEFCSTDDKISKLNIKNPPIFTGIATSLSAWRSAHYLISMQIKDAPILVNTCDLLDYFYPQDIDDRALFIMSRSGESAEIERLLNTISKERIVVGITEGHDSMLATKANAVLTYKADEQAFPNTISFTISQIYALATVISLGYKPTKSLDVLLQELSLAGKELDSKVSVDKRIGKLLAKAGAIIVEGQGLMTGVVEQYGLDFHETRAAGIPVVGGIMRHGVIELTELEDVVTVMLVPDDDIRQRKFRLAQELFNAGKSVVVLTDSEDCVNYDFLKVQIPCVSEEFKSVLFSMGMQKIYSSYIEAKGLSSLKPALVGKVTREE